MPSPELHVVPILSDNYTYFFRDPDSGVCAVVDPGDSGGAQKGLDQLGWNRLDSILVTHRHGDHVGGVSSLKQRYKATVIAPAAEAHQIPDVDKAVREGERITLGQLTAEVIATPGHTKGHIAYFLPEGPLLFAGDTLFAMGCGRLFEGSAAEMWDSLKKLRNLPEATRACCGHEYTQTNARFALDVDGHNPAIQERAREVQALREKNQPTLPTTLAEENRTNPFLRADAPEMASQLGLSSAYPVAVFAELRQRRNRY